MSDIRKQVESILKSHTEMKRQLSVLEYELDAQQRMLDPTVIEDKVFSHPEGEWVSGSRPSNKTADIVVEHIDSQRNAKYHALKNLIYNMRLEVNRLEYSLSLLPQEEAEVIRWFYFEELGWAAITAKTLVSQSTVQRRKRNGFEKLVSHYAVLDKLSVQSDDVRTRARFISYVHEEQYSSCLKRVKENLRTPGLEAALYVVSGCNELWNTGADTLIDFTSGEMIPQESMTASFTEQGSKLLRLACCYAQGLALHRLPHVVNSFFPGLEHLHLELAIEGMRLALFAN